MRLFDSTVDYGNANGNVIIDDLDFGEPSANEEGVITTEYIYEGFEPMGMEWLLAPARPASESDAEPEPITLYYPPPGEEQGYQVFLDEDHDVSDQHYNVNARHFDPTIGRWLSQDPLGFDAGDTNLYRYCEPERVAGSSGTPEGPERLARP